MNGAGAERLFPRSMAVSLSIAAVALGLTALVSRSASLEASTLLHNDFTQDYVSARAWEDGADPYRPTISLVARYLPDGASSYRPLYQARMNPHPPSEIALARAVAWMPYASARATWLIIDAILLAAAATLAARHAGWSVWTSASIGVGCLALPIVQQDLIWGQIGGLLLLLLVLSARWLDRDRPVASGVALGILSALKLYPLAFMIPLLRQKRWMAAAVQGATFAVLSGGVAFFLGSRGVQSYIARAAPENFEFWRSSPMNFSLSAIPFRWLTESPWRPDAPNLPVLAWTLAVALGLTCVAQTMLRPSVRPHAAIIDQAPWILLAAPLVWPFTLVLVIPLLLSRIRELSSPLGAGDVVFLVSAAAIIVAPLPGLPLPSSEVSAAARLAGYGLPTYALAVVAVTTRRTVRAQQLTAKSARDHS